MIVSTWLDRPLSIAGRIIIKQDNQIVSKIINIKKPILMIPNMCIHFNREINKGYEYNFARDMVPFIGQDDLGNDILSLVSEELNVNKEDVLNFDLFTYNFEKGYLWGKNDEYISSAIEVRKYYTNTYTNFSNNRKYLCNYIDIWCTSALRPYSFLLNGSQSIDQVFQNIYSTAKQGWELWTNNSN